MLLERSAGQGGRLEEAEGRTPLQSTEKIVPVKSVTDQREQDRQRVLSLVVRARPRRVSGPQHVADRIERLARQVGKAATMRRSAFFG